MSSVKIILSTLVLATYLVPISYVSANSSELSLARKTQLSHIVKQDCGSCHGMTLKGGLGPALLPESLEEKTVQFLQHTILYGRTGTAMPPWRTLLTEQEALWVSQQLKSGGISSMSND